MHITDYPTIPTLTDTNVLLVDGDQGTKTILAHDAAKAFRNLMTTEERVSGLDLSELNGTNQLTYDDYILLNRLGESKPYKLEELSIFKTADLRKQAAIRRALYRGINLGTAVTNEQWEEIRKGTFRGMFVGDYWAIGDRLWMIMDFNYWLNTGRNESITTEPHLVIMPLYNLYVAPMYNELRYDGGYANSDLRKTGLSNAESIINAAFGSDHILEHDEMLCNAVTDNKVSGWTWYRTKVEIPSCMMVYGYSPYDYPSQEIQSTQFSYYKFRTSNERGNCWLRDVTPLTGYFMAKTYMGSVSGYAANADFAGVRPYFAIKG